MGSYNSALDLNSANASLMGNERNSFQFIDAAENDVSYQLLDRERESEDKRFDLDEPMEVLDKPNHICSFEYLTLLLIGISSLWPWNCYLSAVVYFRSRLESNIMMRENISSALMASSTIASCIFNFLLSYKQDGANYSKRSQLGQWVNICVFFLLALSCYVLTSVNVTSYFVFLLISMVISSIGTALLQNGTFATFSTFGENYVQVIMVGQGVAGILPPITLILSILFVNPRGNTGVSTIGGGTAISSMLYFLAAVFVCAVSLLSLVIFFREHNNVFIQEERSTKPKVHVSLLTLLKKLKVPGSTIFVTFMISMVFPVFAANISSLNEASSSRVFNSDIFVPFSFLVWNCGDLTGRISCSHSLLVVGSPRTMTLYSIARIAFLPMFFLCNIKGLGAIIPSDFFYMSIQFLFGFTNGQLGSSALMCARDFVSEDEQEASGGFMILILSLGLAAGSVLSFLFVRLIN